MAAGTARPSFLRMTGSPHDGGAHGEKSLATSAVLWETVLPALGLALILGAPLLPALAIAAAAALAAFGVFAPESRPGRWGRRAAAHLGPHRVVRGS